jgi:hypothetical protein
MVAPQALPLPKARDRWTRKMSRAAGVGDDKVGPDYHRVSQACRPGPTGNMGQPVKGVRHVAGRRSVAPLRLPSIASARREGTGGRFGRETTEVDHGAAVVVGGGHGACNAAGRPPTPLAWRAGGLAGDLFSPRGGKWSKAMASPSQGSFFRARRQDSMSAASR